MPNIRVVLRWANGQASEAIIPGGETSHFYVDGRSHCFNPSGDVDANGLPIWIECPPDEHQK